MRAISQKSLSPHTKPTAYILGFADFMGLSIEVNEDVLIPRPETELLTEKALKIIKNIKNPVVADIGTGSGAIACAIKSFRQDAYVIGTDISMNALEVAQRSAKRLKLEIDFRHGSLLEPVKEKVDLIVANLPCLDPNKNYLEEILWEPPLALFSQDKGFLLISKLLDSLSQNLKNYGNAILEIHPPLAEKIKNYFAQKNTTINWKIEKDYNLRERYLVIALPSFG